MSMVGCFASLPTAALRKLQDDPDLIETVLHPEGGAGEPPHYVEVDKAWHGIHYLLTGRSEGGSLPHSLAVLGGTEFGPEVGYGPARFLTADQVREVAAALAALPAQALAQRYDPSDMEAKQVYPSIWARDGQAALAYILEGYRQLQLFYQDAAARGEAVLQWLS